MCKLGYFPGLHVKNNVTYILEDLAKAKPNHIAFYWAKNIKQWSFNLADKLEHQSIERGTFVENIGRVASGLRKVGLKKNDRVILFVPMSIELYTIMAAIQRIGAIPVFLDSWARRTHLEISARMVEPAAMISFEKAFEFCAGVEALSRIPIKISVWPSSKTFSTSYEELLQEDADCAIEAVQQEDTGLITFTTGSSGTPKGANRTHRFLSAQHYAINKCIPYLEDDIDLPVFPIFSLNNLAEGVSTVIPAFDVGAPQEHDGLILFAQLQACAATCTTLSAFLLKGLAHYCQQHGIELTMMRRIITGGAPISRDNLIDISAVATKAEIWVLYGSTEVEPMTHIEAKEMINFKSKSMEDPEWVDQGVNVGHFADDIEYRFLKINKGPIEIQAESDWQALEVPHGEVGELIVAGEHVCRDYYNYPEAFKKSKIKDTQGKVWHRTGDLARLDENGYVWMVGRVHNVIERGGSYCYPVRAEIVIKLLPFVKNAAYLGVPDSALGEKAVCVIEPHDRALLGDPEITGAWQEEIERLFKKNKIIHDGIFFREAIPMDPRHHSKVEYQALREALIAEGLV